ncbi:uncharacterized protein [Henckelia pumila]|uniref:uncharacterized protein isoform X3 n=1 Tax=Henckelia pumila TaxID=405737 RepID=UPI003C6E89A7
MYYSNCRVSKFEAFVSFEFIRLIFVYLLVLGTIIELIEVSGSKRKACSFKKYENFISSVPTNQIPKEVDLLNKDNIYIASAIPQQVRQTIPTPYQLLVEKQNCNNKKSYELRALCFPIDLEDEFLFVFL